MTITPTFNRRMHYVFHSLGLSCLGGSIFLQVLVFVGILQHGYFMAVEQNLAILAAEVAVTGFAAVYFVYVYLRLIRSVK